MSFTAEEFESAAEVDALRKANRTLELKLLKAKAGSAELIEATYQAAKDAALLQGHAPAVSTPRPDRRSKRAEVALLPLSDWHVGKRTSSFDSDVARQRIDRLAAKVVEITEIERADHPVNECHVLLLGDFLDGVIIFPGQSFEIDSTLFSQLFTTVGILEGLVRTLLSTFRSVTVWSACGNHARLGKKGDMPRGDNVDRVLYRIVRDRLTAQKRLTWHEPQSWYSIAEIGSYRAMIAHGDQIKSFGGTPAFAILKKCNSWASGVLPPFRDVWMGHFHNPLVLPLANGRGRVFISPSIESDSAYAAEVVAAAGVPAQRLCFVDPDKARLTSERLIWLDA